MQNTIPQKEALLSRKSAASLLGVCKTTLDRLDIPKVKLRRRVLYRLTVIEKWLNDNTKQEGTNEK